MTTLRDMLIAPMPDLSEPEYTHAPNEWIHNENWKYARKLFQDAAAWVAQAYAGSINYVSDSTVDTHHAMIATLTALHKVIYMDDYTAELPDLISGWLDDEFIAQDFYTSSYDANTGLPDAPMPHLFTLFNPDSDALYNDNQED